MRGGDEYSSVQTDGPGPPSCPRASFPADCTPKAWPTCPTSVRRQLASLAPHPPGELTHPTPQSSRELTPFGAPTARNVPKGSHPAMAHRFARRFSTTFTPSQLSPHFPILAPQPTRQGIALDQVRTLANRKWSRMLSAWQSSFVGWSLAWLVAAELLAAHLTMTPI